MIKTENKSFTELVTSNFPSVKEQECLVNELRHSGFLDVFEVSRTDATKPTNVNELEFQWGCFLCNHPEKAVGFLHGTNQPMIEGQLKEKKGKWRLFRRWRTRYFTLSGAHLSCKGSVSVFAIVFFVFGRSLINKPIYRVAARALMSIKFGR